MLTIEITRILFLFTFSAVLAVLWTPLLTNFLYQNKLWKKKARNKAIDGKSAEVFYNLHKGKETKIPRLGGILIWLTTLAVVFLFSFLARILPNNPWLENINFLSRSQTWLPLGFLAAGALLGLSDDLLQVFDRGKYIGGGMRFSRRFLFMVVIGAIGGWWFYYKLGWMTIFVPFLGDVNIGWFYIPLFIITNLGCWAGGVIDGIDGLAGGAFSLIFAAFSVIAFSQMQFDLAAFCAVLAGTILAFLWFNIPPARFYMGESGIMGLTATLTAVAFLTNSVLILPIIAGLLVIEAGSVIIQLLSKKLLGRKIFLSAPIHHHLEAKGWSQPKITMRFWILGMIMAILGVIIKLSG
jgi:phospho-N-acetylmuramoyl-pentapeptide-transferase